MAKHGLGRGLEALIRDGTPPASSSGPDSQFTVEIKKVQKSSVQPRQQFDEAALADLTASIKDRGVLQPLLVRKKGRSYELIAGERRLRAASAAGLEKVPVILLEGSECDALEVALVENLQREDLNVIEEAEGYQALVEKFDLTQEEIAGRVGKPRPSIANTVRLLSLPLEVKALVVDGALSAGHAKLLTGLDDVNEQRHLAELASKENWTVRGLEKAIEKTRRAPRKPRSVRRDIPSDHLSYISDKLHQRFGTSVKINPSRTYANGRKGKGSIEIDFYSNEEFDRILELLGYTAE